MPVDLKLLAPLPALAAALILATDRRIVSRLRRLHATDAATATALAPPGPLGGMRLRRLIGAGAVRQCAAGYFLDEAGYATWRRRRRTRALTILFLILAVLATLALLGAM